METIVLTISIGVMNILCFFIGAKVGQKVVKNETIKMPTINPIEIVKNHEEKKEVQKEIEEIETMLDNINNYDGSSLGQKQI